MQKRMNNPGILDKNVADVIVDNSVLKLVYNRTNGHPNHLIVLVKWFVDSRNVVYNEVMGGFRFPNEMSELQARMKLPGTLKDLIVSRVDFLTDGEARVILKVAAVIGPEFKASLLLQILNREGNEITEEKLKSKLETLQDLGFILLGRRIDEDMDKGEKTTEQDNSHSTTLMRLAPKMKYKIKRYLDHESENWSFSAEVTQQAIKDLVPHSRVNKIEAILQQIISQQGGKTGSKVFKRR